MYTQLQEVPQDFSLRTRLMDVYLLLGDTRGAETLVGEAERLYLNSAEPVVLQGQKVLGLLVAQGDVPEEEHKLDRLSQLAAEADYLDDGNPGTLYLEGMLNKLKADNLKAEEYFLRALYADPGYLKAQQALIDLYADQHDSKLAAPLLSQALDEDPHNVDTLYLVGRVFIEKGDPGRGLVYLQKSADLDAQERPKRLLMMAEAQRQLGQAEEAMTNYQKVLNFWPNRADLWEKYADMADALGREDLVIPAYQKAYRLQPAILNKLITRAEHVFWTQSVTAAIAEYTRLTQIAPERSDLLTLLIDMHYRNWQEGIFAGETTLNQLEEPLREQEKEQLTPPLQLADIQIQAMRLNEWSPGLQKVTRDVIQSAASPYIQATGELLLGQPAEAEEYAKSFGAAMTPRQEVQRFVLIGAWPWALRFAQNNADLSDIQEAVTAWSDRENQKANEQMAQAKTFIQNHLYDQALAALKKAQIAHPLSAELQLYYASAYTLHGDLTDAKAALANAQKLGLPQTMASQFNAIAKELATAEKQQTKP